MRLYRLGGEWSLDDRPQVQAVKKVDLCIWDIKFGEDLDELKLQTDFNEGKDRQPLKVEIYQSAAANSTKLEVLDGN